MYFGVDYYPEHWPEDRWPIDAKMMKEANINVVRLAEFAWARLEPKEGIYDFSWLDRAVGILASEGIQIVLGTPTACAPKWLMDKIPDGYYVNSQGIARGFVTRRHYCPTNEAYREYAKQIAARMAEHYSGNPNLIAWQVDNEFEVQCHCDGCHKAFKQWLCGKYHSIDQLNKDWGTDFWSHTYGNWDEIPMPRSYGGNSWQGLSTLYNHNPGMLLDFFRFSSDSIIAFMNLQIEEIRKRCSLPITNNVPEFNNEFDFYKLGKTLDFMSWDNYPRTMWMARDEKTVAMEHDRIRGIKNRNYWMIEQQSGPCGWNSLGDTPEPGQVRLWTYQALSHGAEAILYFRWRPSTSGIEQHWHGILDHDGIGRRRYREIRSIGAELSNLNDLFIGSENQNPVAIIKSYEHLWSHRGQPPNKKFDYNALLQSYYNAVAENDVNLDVTGVHVPFSKYKMVIMPAFHMMSEEIGDKCKDYVLRGGTLLITFRSGIKSWNNRMSTQTVPGCFRELAGLELEDFDSLNNGRTVGVNGRFGEGTASIWCDVVALRGAEVLATYTSHFFQGTPAVTVHGFGDGRLYYVACDLDEKAMVRLMASIFTAENIAPAMKIGIPGVEVIRKGKKGLEFFIVLNHSNEMKAIPLDGRMVDLITGNKGYERWELPPYGVVVLTDDISGKKRD